jgi:hypothetical protein
MESITKRESKLETQHMARSRRHLHDIPTHQAERHLPGNRRRHSKTCGEQSRRGKIPGRLVGDDAGERSLLAVCFSIFEPYLPHRRASSWSWAFQGAPVQFLLRDDEKIACEVISASYETKGEDPFGEVISGSLKLRAPTVDLTLQCDLQIRIPKINSQNCCSKATSWARV